MKIFKLEARGQAIQASCYEKRESVQEVCTIAQETKTVQFATKVYEELPRQFGSN